MFRIQAVILCLCLLSTVVKGQQSWESSQTSSSTSSFSARQLVIQWDSGTFQVNQAWVSGLAVKYPDKIQRINLIPSNTKAVMVHFTDGRIQEEDLLQVLEMEGVPSPYYIANGRKYLLGQDKSLVNEPVK